jgi:hypothetical protein
MGRAVRSCWREAITLMELGNVKSGLFQFQAGEWLRYKLLPVPLLHQRIRFLPHSAFTSARAKTIEDSACDRPKLRECEQSRVEASPCHDCCELKRD